MSVFIENEYGKNIDIDYNTIIKKVVEEAIDFVKCPFECEVNVTIVDNDSIKEINKAQRDIDKETDVLSFPLGSGGKYDRNMETGALQLGDIVISKEHVLAQAEAYAHSPKREFAFLIAHSMLHLFGFDHMEEEERMIMEAKQREIMEKVQILR